MTLLRSLLLIAALLSNSAWALPLEPAVVTTTEMRAELVVHVPEGVRPGKPMWLGLHLQHQPHWHSYWLNPGDSGLPTTLQWKLPEGLTAGAIEWPTPRPLPIGSLMNFGYEDSVLLPVAVTVPAGFKGQELTVGLHAQWLVCKEVCIPQSGDFSITIPADAASVAHQDLFAQAHGRAPVPGAQGKATVDANGLRVSVDGLPTAWRDQVIQFFPESANLLDNAGPREARWNGQQWSARLPLSALRGEAPARLFAVLSTADAQAGMRVDIEVRGDWPAIATIAPSTPEISAAAKAEPRTSAAQDPGDLGLGLALVLALIGGALLNLMPCVFPVLSLKVIGFASHAHDRRALLAGGLAYSVGVVLSFVLLAALMLALRAGGEQLGWGFQLQAPGFVAALALLFTLIGLNLAGVFEFSNLLPSGLAALRARHPLIDSALTGVLAVAVASPCTAPFMGASVGLALALPAASGLLVFAALGLGMALPYLAASAWPALARLLPRPGVWMAHFRMLMAFPMFATVVWLVWVLGQQTGIDGAAALLALLVSTSFVAWVFGMSDLGRKARASLGVLATLAFAATLAWAVPQLHETALSAARVASTDQDWEPWSAARVAELTAQGRPVFVDFTAAWCVTCQFNKRTTLSDAGLLADVAARGVVLMRADWTRRDDAITMELRRLGRDGVPVYALFSPAGGDRPLLLPEILSVNTVRAALAAL